MGGIRDNYYTFYFMLYIMAGRGRGVGQNPKCDNYHPFFYFEGRKKSQDKTVPLSGAATFSTRNL